jgi:hypothetical protein
VASAYLSPRVECPLKVLNEGDNVLMLGVADICVMLPQGEAEQQYRLVITSMEESGEEEEDEVDNTLTTTIRFEHTYSGIPFLQINTTQYMTGTTSMTSVEEKVEVSSSLKGVQYCAESGSVLKFDADNPMLEVSISVEKLSPTECCVKQPVFRHSTNNNNNDGVDKIMKCPATVSKETTDSVCWSTSHYSLRADSLQYSIADTAVVVDWKDRTVFEEEKCVLPSDKKYPVLSDGIPTVPLATTKLVSQYQQEIRVDFLANGERCIVMSVLSTNEYWFIDEMQLCNGDGYESFTRSEINIGGSLHRCYTTSDAKITNTNGSTIAFTNLSLEVLLPWSNGDSNYCASDGGSGDGDDNSNSSTTSPTGSTNTTVNTQQNNGTSSSDVEKEMNNGDDDRSSSPAPSSSSSETTTTTSSTTEIAGLPLEVFIGVLCGGLVTLVICVNGLLFWKYCSHRQGHKKRRENRNKKRSSGGNRKTKSRQRSNGDGIVCKDDDPKGTTTVMDCLADGRVMCKKIIPLKDGTSIVQKTLFPDEETAAHFLSRRYSVNLNDDNPNDDDDDDYV